MTRQLWVLIHRWAGLAMAGFLILIGLTGSLLAFYPEVERLINPQYYPARASGLALGPGELAEILERRLPQAQVNALILEANQGATLAAVGARPGEAPLGFDHVFLDPTTGEELFRRQFGTISEGWTNVMGFVYRLHYNLALAPAGKWILGVCALVWTLDCFVALYLTLPQRRESASHLLRSTQSGNAEAKTWWQRWKPAWRIRWRQGGYKLTFDLHRAGGLWLWLILLVFAGSSVYMNLGDTVYTWAMRAVTDFEAPWTELALLDEPLQNPRHGWIEAQTTGERLMERQAALHGFTVERPIALRLDRLRGVYIYSVRSSRDIQDKRGMTRLFFDADTGELKLLLLPTGQQAGNTMTSWLFALHEANVFGLPYRFFVCLLGLAIVMLSVTGIVIWMKKRRARRLRVAASARGEMHMSRGCSADKAWRME